MFCLFSKLKDYAKSEKILSNIKKFYQKRKCFVKYESKLHKNSLFSKLKRFIKNENILMMIKNNFFSINNNNQ